MEKLIVKNFNDFLNNSKYTELKKQFLDYIDLKKLKTFGLALKNLRQGLNLSQKEFGLKIDKKQNTILKYEIGFLKISNKVWTSIINTFNVEYDTLLKAFDISKNSLEIEVPDFIDDINELLLTDVTDNSDIYGYTAFEIIDNFIVDKINDSITELLNFLYPSYEKSSLSINSTSNNSIFERIREKIESLEDSSLREIQLLKLKKIEKDIENYTIFLLKQNGFSL